MLNRLIMFLITFVVFMAIDLIWLGLIAKNLYKKYLGHLMKKDVNWAAAIIFYVIFIAGLIFFVIDPALEKESLSYALFAGGALGLLCYATYDLTNLATLKEWPVALTMIDLIWGTVLSGATAGISFGIIHYLL